MKRYIAEGLARFLEENPMAWHMPGHKRIWTGLNSEGGPIDDALAKAICMDVTEVPGTDDLYEPTEMIAKSMQELTKVYKTYSSYYLVNGSTGGILSAIAAVAECRAGKVIVAENCHKSVFNGVKLMGLEPIYLSPDLTEIAVEKTSRIKINSDIKAKRVEEICRTEKIAAMIITSPTYEGVFSDVQAIANILHRYGALLIVDEAHGAHLPFVAGLPKSAL
ncbi:MAG: aminotransferase class I/II-fold pyridoxal phosphate-dependent enzyme, partial [Wujia sp.]